MRFRCCRSWWTLLLLVYPGLAPSAVPLADWDFTTGDHAWVGNRQVAELVSSPDGLLVRCLGEDPWIEGPRFDAPHDGFLRVTVEMRTDADAVAQVFYGKTFHASRCRTFSVVNDGRFHSYPLILPESTGPGTRLRLDPCFGAGEVAVRRIRIEAVRTPVPPVFDEPAVPRDSFLDAPSICSGRLIVDHHPGVWNGIRVRLDDHDLARGYDGEMIGVQLDGGVEYLKLKDGALRVEEPGGKIIVARTTVTDSRGAHWAVERNFAVPAPGDAITVETTIGVDQDREALLLPWLTLLAGQGSHGARKHQGLFAGLEYLADEPSSSKADLTGPAHVRRVPDPVKITFPLMAVEHGGRYVGLSWETSSRVAAGFDSPDRVFGSGGHAMWLSGPGVGDARFENDLVAHSPLAMKAGVPVTVRASIIVGKSASVLGAVQQYVSSHPLPALPRFEGGFETAVDLLAHGWLDSGINEEWRFRHADWMDRFKPQPAAGPAMFLSWLGQKTPDRGLALRAEEGVRQTLARIAPGDPYASAVSHVRLPVAPLIFGKVPEFVAQKRAAAFRQLRQFDARGRIIYRPGERDYGRTHFEPHANGIGGRVLADVLEAATLSADAELIAKALAVLDQQAALYANTVPRGAQTWEIPLHTPDILASAHMIRACVYGYVLTGRADYLDQARYWAWSGVPFVYLANPTDGACGPYATIAVLGATNWVAPVWLGNPVQWCGLVYGSALHLLAKYDSSGPWRQLAKGITLAGLQMTWPTSDAKRQGLLPDFFHLGRQQSDGPAINPGTVGAHLPEAFERGKLHDLYRCQNGWIVHAPCVIHEVQETERSVQFRVAGWGGKTPYRILVAGVRELPGEVLADGAAVVVRHDADLGILVVPLDGPCGVEIKDRPDAGAEASGKGAR